MKLKIYKIIFSILIIALIIIIGVIVIKYVQNYMNEQENRNIVEEFSTAIKENTKKNESNQENVTIQGYNVIGILKIPKIQLEYPILDIDTYNPAETKAPLKISIVKYWGGKVNQYGNLSIAGHNNYDGTMFGKIKKLNIGDIIELTDLKSRTIQYQIYEKFVTNPNDITILETNDETIREVTIITCTNGNRNRLILKAKELIN